jgi:DNA-binding helix-hairpin-helix protein with protein kinase domain
MVSITPVDSGGKITLGDELGTGAEGFVYRIDGKDNEVAKIFKEELRSKKRPKIQAMVSNPPVDPTFNQHNIRSIIWPVDIIRDSVSGEFLGYKMPYKNSDNHQTITEYTMTNLGWDTSNRRDRRILSLNLAIAIYEIHRQGHAIGDLNNKNIIVENWFISLIDCDGFYIQGKNETFSGETHYPRYTPPEGRGDSIREVQYSDRFGLGVHIFQLLMEGFHPFHAQGEATVAGSCEDWIREHPFPYKNPKPGQIEPHEQTPDYGTLHPTIKKRFTECFVYGKNNPEKRPTARDWAKTLYELENDDEFIQQSQSENPWEGWKSLGGRGEKESVESDGKLWDEWEMEQETQTQREGPWENWDVSD